MDAIFKALADPARRDLLDALRHLDGQTLSDLSARFEMTRFGVMKHLAVLEEAGLVNSVKRGRIKHRYRRRSTAGWNRCACSPWPGASWP